MRHCPELQQLGPRLWDTRRCICKSNISCHVELPSARPVKILGVSTLLLVFPVSLEKRKEREVIHPQSAENRGSSAHRAGNSGSGTLHGTRRKEGRWVCWTHPKATYSVGLRSAHQSPWTHPAASWPCFSESWGPLGAEQGLAVRCV